MADFSFGLTEGSFLLWNGHKHLRSVAEDLTSDKQKRTERIYQGTDIIKLSSQYFSTGHKFVWFTRRVKMNITWWRRHRYSCLSVFRLPTEHLHLVLIWDPGSVFAAILIFPWAQDLAKAVNISNRYLQPSKLGIWLMKGYPIVSILIILIETAFGLYTETLHWVLIWDPGSLPPRLWFSQEHEV